jgi:hypothetical protein
MSMAPRRAQARQVAVRRGRRNLALLVAAASLTAGAAALPPIAGGTEPGPGCAEPSPGAIVAADGASVTCPPATTTPADPDASSALPATAEPPPAPEPTPEATPPAAPATEEPAHEDSAPAGDVGPAEPAGDATATADTPAAPASTASTAPGPSAPASTAPDDDHPASRPPHRRPAAARPDATPRPNHGRPAAVRHHRDQADVAPAPPAPPPDTVLPAEWTSLEPIVLPAFSLADFPVPAELLPLFQAAGAEYGVPWQVLAAINEIETAYGRNAHMSTAGAVGFMQFLPSTWARWGRDADGDRRRDPRNPADAVFSAARYLHAAGARDDLARAIFAYNHADWYVEQVLHRARELASLDPDQVAALTDRALTGHRRLYEVAGSPFFGPGVLEPSAGQALLMTTRQLTRLVLKDDRITIYPCGREDIAAGHVDRRVLATLLFLADSGHDLRVSSLRCGHSRLTTSGNVSAHSYGAAVDIAEVDGLPILGHQGPGSITDEIVHRLLDLQGLMRPDQIITLMTVDDAPNTLAVPDHDDHIHIGFGRPVALDDPDR